MSGEEKFVLYGPEPYVPIPEKSLGQILYESLISHGNNHYAMVDAFTDTSTTYNKILQKSCDLAEALRKYGCTNETVISMFSENNVDYFIPVVASLFAGTITAPINHFYRSYELNHIINLTQPMLLFVSSRTVTKFMQLKGHYPFLKRIIIYNTNQRVSGTQTLNEFITEQLKGQQVLPYNFRPWTGNIKEQVAFIMSSSGTTGLSKGVMLTHINMNTRMANEWDPRYGDTELINHVSTGFLPFYHAYGLSVGITALVKGNLLVLFDHFDETVFLKAIPKYKVTILNVVPSVAIFLTKTNELKKYDVSTVIKVLCGGAVLTGSTERTLKERLGITYLASAYGQTELTLACTQVKKADGKSGTCGQVLPFSCLKICDPLTGKALGPNEKGEVRVKGSLVMKGYYRNKKATDEAFTADGWLKTGDLGYVDKEGYLYIVDRLKELIKYNAFQIPPAELESLLISHPKVLEAAVVGRPDEKSGELPTAFVVRRTSDVTEKEIQDFIAEKVSPQKKLRGGVIFIPELPKNATGKVLRRVLREKFSEENKKCKL